MLKTIYLIGQPGSGKTTLAKAFLQQFNDNTTTSATQPFKHEVYHQDVPIYSLGFQIGLTFGGTDTLPNTVINKIVAWYPTIDRPAIIFGEGDRLSNQRFFDFCKQQGELVLVLVNTQDDVAAQRRAERSQREKKPLQNASWIKGRITKSKNLVAANAQHVVIDGTAALDVQLQQLNDLI